MSKQRSKSDEKDLIACCGLVCSHCPVFIATKNDDKAAREEIAAQWSSEFGQDIDPAEINCVGCTVKRGAHIGNCSICEIRKCVIDKRMKNCAECPDYICETLQDFLDVVPEARLTLEGIRTFKKK